MTLVSCVDCNKQISVDSIDNKCIYGCYDCSIARGYISQREMIFV